MVSPNIQIRLSPPRDDILMTRLTNVGFDLSQDFDLKDKILSLLGFVDEKHARNLKIEELDIFNLDIDTARTIGVKACPQACA